MKAFGAERNRGVALLMVLGSLALITVLVVAFLTQTTAELRSAKSFSHGASTRLLADTALNLVMAQIRDGTRGYKDQPKDGNLLAWASQPGAIRTFNQNGDLETLYKLYSDDRMQVDNPDSLEDDLDELKAWESSPAYYTDLNAPVVTGEGGQAVTNYPIVDPAAEGKVEGFEIDDSATPKTAHQAAPMPVRWLYVLEDGSLAPAPVTTGGNTVTVSNCSPRNRVIGRVAFWTDDETCKLNINTASEGVFWDQPRSAGINEVTFAVNPPVSDEWQRTPGHPATTCLSVVFSNLNLGSYSNTVRFLHEVSPRVSWGGSQLNSSPNGNPARFKPSLDGGSAPGFVPRLNFSGTKGELPAVQPTNIVAAASPLFSTADELMFFKDESGAREQSDVLEKEDILSRLFFSHFLKPGSGHDLVWRTEALHVANHMNQ